MALIEIEHLTFAYPGCAPAVNDVSLSIERGAFVVLCGRSGSGKTTLLNCIKPETVPFGQKSGGVTYDGADAAGLSRRDSARVGYVTQTSLPLGRTVIDDLKFGVENLGLGADALAETVTLLGLTPLLNRDLDALSGGERKLVQLGGVLAMRPETLLLDEPTAQLDPTAAARILDVLRRLNDRGLTIVMTAHRGEGTEHADTLAVLDGGRLAYCGRPCDGPGDFLTTPARVHYAQGLSVPAPLTVRAFLREQSAADRPAATAPAPLQTNTSAPREDVTAGQSPRQKSDEPAVRLKNVRFAFDKNGPDILDGASIELYPGRHYCLLGGVGSGKTTALGVMTGLRRPYAGRAYVFGKRVSDYRNGELYGILTAVSQNPRFMFTETTVRKDLESMLARPAEAGGADELAAELGIADVLDRHPYDLSGGELQLAAMAKALLVRPRILLLDEPSKGLDRASAARVGAVLRRLTDRGVTVVTATHDTDFAADYGDFAAFVFDGRLTPPVPVDGFFWENRWFTTDAARLAATLGRTETGPERLLAAVRRT